MNYYAKIIARSDFQKKDGSSPICIRLTFDRKVKLISLHKSVTLNYWDHTNDQVFDWL